MRAIAVFFICVFVGSPALAMSLGVARDQLAGCFADVAARTTDSPAAWMDIMEKCQQSVLNHSVACMAAGGSKEDCGSQNIKMAYDAIAKARLIKAGRGAYNDAAQKFGACLGAAAAIGDYSGMYDPNDRQSTNRLIQKCPVEWTAYVNACKLTGQGEKDCIVQTMFMALEAAEKFKR